MIMSGADMVKLELFRVARVVAITWRSAKVIRLISAYYPNDTAFQIASTDSTE
jgi:hypothetical protein